MKKFLGIGVVSLLLSCPSAFADVQLSIQNGRVSIVAKDATIRQILTEWARVGEIKILNVERIPGGPLTLELTDVPEQQALDVLLRSVSGYMAAPRTAVAANLSRFDRIVVMPTIAPPKSAAVAAPPATFPQPPFQGQIQPPPQPADDDPDDDRAAPPTPPVPNPRGPVFNTFQQPQIVNPRMPTGGPGGPGMMPQQGPQPQEQPQQAAPGAFPTAPSGGVAVPGMVVQPPAQPGQPTGAPGQPVRRPGGPQGQ
jgi:hypothetical protein